MLLLDLINENILSILIKFINFKNFVNLVISTKELIIYHNSDYFWKKLSYKFKNNFFWELASERTQSSIGIKCNKNLCWKDQLKSIYNYEKNVCDHDKKDISYYILWSNQELIIGYSNKTGTCKANYMLNKIFDYYKFKIYSYVEKILLKKNNIYHWKYYIMMFIENKLYISKFIFNQKIKFLEEVFKESNDKINWILINQIYHLGIGIKNGNNT